MKRYVVIMLLLLLPTAWAAAQNDDEIVVSSGDLKVVGTTGENSTNQPSNPSTLSTYHQPFNGDCSRFFFEGTLVTGTDRDGGIGLNATWLPEHWGAYGSMSFLEHSIIGTCGVALRPVAHPHVLDWQLYAGAAFCDALGFEVGMRFSATADGNHGEFAWWSGSIGRIYINNNIYYTFGMSVNLVAMLGWIIW